MLSIALWSAMTIGALAGPPELTGRAMHDGKPAAGAIVMIASITANDGPGGWIGGIKHPDNGLLARTDADGKFRVPLTGPATGCWTFCIAADGSVAGESLRVGSENVVQLKSAAPGEGAKECHVRVVDPDGKPVPGALVLPTAIQHGGVTMGWGGDLIKSARITDAAGEATIVYEAPGDRPPVVREASGLSVCVIADGWAPCDVAGVNFGETAEARLGRGCRVIGKVTGAKGPIGDAGVDLMPAGVAGDATFAGRRVRTNAAGEFVFEHVLPGTEVWISVPTWLNSAGVVAGAFKVKTLADGETLDAGLFNASAGCRLAGRVVLDKDAALPAGTWVTLAHDHAQLSWAAEVDENGGFSFSGVPKGGPYLLSVFNAGSGMTLISPENAAASPVRQNSLHGMISEDHADLRILLLAAGAERGEELQPRNKPMRGVEEERVQ